MYLGRPFQRQPTDFKQSYFPALPTDFILSYFPALYLATTLRFQSSTYSVLNASTYMNGTQFLSLS